MQLRVGAQTRAARRVATQVPEVAGAYQDLAKTIEAAAPGFRGASAAALAEALRGWFTAAEDLPRILNEYAAKLAEVDRTTAATDAKGSGALSSAPGGSGLNMGPGVPR